MANIIRKEIEIIHVGKQSEIVSIYIDYLKSMTLSSMVYEIKNEEEEIQGEGRVGN